LNQTIHSIARELIEREAVDWDSVNAHRVFATCPISKETDCTK